MIVGVDDRDERRVAECAVAVARGGIGVRIGRAIDHDDRLLADGVVGGCALREREQKI